MSDYQSTAEASPNEEYLTESSAGRNTEALSAEDRIDVVAVQDYIKARAIELLDTMNAGTGFREFVSQHVADHFSGFYEEDGPSGMRLTAEGKEEYITVVEDLYYHRNPNFHTEMENISIEVSEKELVAIAYVTRTDRGLADGIRRETTCQLTWQKLNGKWLIIHDRGIRTFPFLTVDEVLGGGGK